MHLRVFLLANHFRIRSRRTRVHTMIENMGVTSTIHLDAFWWWNVLGRRLRPYTLEFYTKVQVWGAMVRASLHFSFSPKAT